MYNRLFSLFLLIGLLGISISCNCKSKNVNHALPPRNNKPMTEIKLNPSSEFALRIVKRPIHSHDAFPTLLLTVFQVDNGQVLLEDRIPGGEVKWISTYVIEVRSKVGRPRNLNKKHMNFKYRYNVLKKVKIHPVILN